MPIAGLDWYGCMRSQDHATLWDLLHPDAVFESPIVHTPQRGRDIVFRYLSSAEKVLGGPGFAYVGEWRSDAGRSWSSKARSMESRSLVSISSLSAKTDGSRV